MGQNENSPVTKGDVKKFFKIIIWIMASIMVIIFVIGMITCSALRSNIQSTLSEEHKR